ncbi:MAG: peptidoglycan-binding protein [Candidatus Zixiibacteriota bacterium]|nr:MAG: peptidoglycan-binding protein [candidate division Zixibacteria bacterium]
MEMKCEIIENDSRLIGVVSVKVPGIYGRRGNPLPRRMAKLVRPAAVALQKVYRNIVREGGHLFLSDMFRSADQQQRAHEDWIKGRKSAFSPPCCSSVHEAARAIDIDAFDTGIGHRRVRQLLNQHGWTHVVATLTGAECWHYEFRQSKWENYRKQHGYPAMAHAMKEAIGNTAGNEIGRKIREQVTWVQKSLNRLIAARLRVNGNYDAHTRAAVIAFQNKYRLQIDGVAGPITRKKIRELLDSKG